MSVKAKFKVQSVTQYETAKTVKLSAVYGTDGDNADFTQYTPSGELSITINEGTTAYEYFTPGKEYYLTFEESTQV